MVDIGTMTRDELRKWLAAPAAFHVCDRIVEWYDNNEGIAQLRVIVDQAKESKREREVRV